jgi:hypothetical protein
MHHSSLSLAALDGAPVSPAARAAALAEYRAWGAMAGHVFATEEAVADARTPEDIEALCAAGPAPSEIDWTGFEAT